MDLLFSGFHRSSTNVTDLKSEIIKYHILSIFKLNKRFKNRKKEKDKRFYS